MVYQMDMMRSRRSGPFAAGDDAVAVGVGIENPPREAIELRGDVGVAASARAARRS